MSNKLYSVLKFLIGWPLTVVALFFIVKLIAPQAPTLIANMRNMYIPLFVYGIVSFILFYFLRSYIWYRLITGLSHKISFKQSCYMWAVSELKRYIPGSIWSFLGRTVLFEEHGVQKKDIAKSLVVEAELFVLGSLVISVLALPFVLPGFQLQLNTVTGVFVTLSLVAVLLLYVFASNFFLERRDAPSGASRSRKVFRILHFLVPKYPHQENVLLVTLSAIALLFFGLGNYFIIASVFPLHPQMIVELTGFFVLAFVAGYLSLLTPAGFGVREGIMIWGLSRVMSPANAGFAALFSRIILIISELIFILLAYVWHRLVIARSTSDEAIPSSMRLLLRRLTDRNDIMKLEKWVSTHIHETIVLFLSFCYVLYFTTVSFFRYDNFYTGRFDLGNMAQTVWNTTQGRIFLFTNPDGAETVSRMAFHADVILVLLAPFYALWSSPKMLLLIQVVVVAAGAFFVYLIAQHIIKNKNISLVFAFAYLMNPSVQRANMYDFHAVVLATTFFLATYYFYTKRTYVLFVLFAVLAALCKEQIWVIIALFGGLLIIRQKKFVLGALMVVFSLSMFYALVWHVIPNTLGAHHFALSFYAELGDGPSGVIKTILFSPQKILAIVFEESRIDYLKQLFSPLGYLSLVSPLFLIFAGPDFAINLLSSNANFQQIYYQYTATITPFIFISAIWGVWVMQYLITKIDMGRWRLSQLTSFVIIVYILFASLNAQYKFGPLPGSKEPNLDPLMKPLADKEYIDTFLSQIPQDYRVVASNNVGSHLSNREHIYVVPLGLDKADLAVFLLTDPWSIKRDTALVAKLRTDPQYGLVTEKGKFVVFKRNN